MINLSTEKKYWYIPNEIKFNFYVFVVTIVIFGLSSLIIGATKNIHSLIKILDSGYSNEFTKFTFHSLLFAFLISIAFPFIRTKFNLFCIYTFLVFTSFNYSIYLCSIMPKIFQPVSILLAFLFAYIFNKTCELDNIKPSSDISNDEVKYFINEMLKTILGIVFTYSTYLIFYFSFKFFFDRDNYQIIGEHFFSYALISLVISFVLKSIVDVNFNFIRKPSDKIKLSIMDNKYVIIVSTIFYFGLVIIIYYTFLFNI